MGWCINAYQPNGSCGSVCASEGVDPFCVVGSHWYFYDNPNLTLDGDNKVAKAPHNNTEPVSQVYPNPATDRISLELNLENAVYCSYRIYDIAGRCVCMEELGVLSAGRHTLIIPLDDSGRALPVGVYSISIATGETTTNRRVVVR